MPLKVKTSRDLVNSETGEPVTNIYQIVTDWIRRMTSLREVEKKRAASDGDGGGGPEMNVVYSFAMLEDEWDAFRYFLEKQADTFRLSIEHPFWDLADAAGVKIPGDVAMAREQLKQQREDRDTLDDLG